MVSTALREDDHPAKHGYSDRCGYQGAPRRSSAGTLCPARLSHRIGGVLVPRRHRGPPRGVLLLGSHPLGRHPPTRKRQPARTGQFTAAGPCRVPSGRGITCAGHRRQHPPQPNAPQRGFCKVGGAGQRSSGSSRQRSFDGRHRQKIPGILAVMGDLQQAIGADEHFRRELVGLARRQGARYLVSPRLPDRPQTRGAPQSPPRGAHIIAGEHLLGRIGYQRKRRLVAGSASKTASMASPRACKRG